MPTVDDATAFLIDYIRRPRPANGYPTFGYDIYLPNVVTSYIVEVGHSTEHLSMIYNGLRARELSPLFYESAWDLSRRGILRPSVRQFGQQVEGSGDGYSLTIKGSNWLANFGDTLIILEPTRLTQAFRSLASRLGPAFLQRASEASQCHSLGLHLACCAMCGAGAESILLTVAIAKSRDEAATLRTYRSAQGRRLITNQIVRGARSEIVGPFTAATGLLAYWRDDAAHGSASNISEIEAHEALSRLLRFAQFANDHWTELVA